VKKGSLHLFGVSLIFLSLFLWAGLPALRAHPSIEEEFEKALSLYKKEEYTRALKIFQRLGGEYGEHRLRPDSIFMQAHAHRALQKWPEAAQAFSRAAEVHPLLSDYALFFQGEALQKAGEGEKSLQVFQRLAALHPQSLLAPRARLRMAEIHLQSGDYGSAAQVCEKLLLEAPDGESSAQARLLLGQAREGQEQWPEAVKAYQELWLKNPLSPGAKRAKARWESLAKGKRIPATRISPEALFQRALQFYQAQQYETALSEWNQIEGFPPQAYPDHYSGEPWIDDLYLHRGMAKFRLKHYSQALETFELIVRNTRNEAMAEKGLFWMIPTLVRLGRTEEVLEIQPLFQSLFPRSPFLAQSLYLRAAVYEDMGETAKAVKLYREIAEQFPQSPLRFSALWNAGWLLYRAQDFSGALQYWDRLKAMNSPYRWREKVLYWKGRCLERMGRVAEAEGMFGQLLKDSPTSYYSQLVLQRRNPQSSPAAFPPLRDQTLSPFMELKAFSSGSRALHLEKGRALTRLGLLSPAVEELEAAEEEGVNVEEMWLEISRLYREAEEYYRSNLLVRKKFTLKPLTGQSTEREKALYLLAFPPGKGSFIQQYARERNLDPALLCALILEESRFHSQAISSAGARGWMQVLPRTGQRIAKELRLSNFSEDQLFDPAVNVRLGSWYFSKLLEEFGGKTYLALAAYNAGPHLVRKWLGQAPNLAEDEFVENIPFAETRNYVTRVLSSAQVYRTLYRPPAKPVQP